MSKVAIAGDSSGTGTFTIKSPNSNSDRTLNLPDSAGTLATAESTLAQFNASGSAPVYACRAWVNFNGTGTVAIRASGNVSSITDLGVGNYQVNFTTAMPDANYSVTGFSPPGSNGTNVTFLALRDAPLAAYCAVRQIATGGGGGGDTDSGFVCVAVFR